MFTHQTETTNSGLFMYAESQGYKVTHEFTTVDGTDDGQPPLIGEITMPAIDIVFSKQYFITSNAETIISDCLKRTLLFTLGDGQSTGTLFTDSSNMVLVSLYYTHHDAIYNTWESPMYKFMNEPSITFLSTPSQSGGSFSNVRSSVSLYAHAYTTNTVISFALYNAPNHITDIASITPIDLKALFGHRFTDLQHSSQFKEDLSVCIHNRLHSVSGSMDSPMNSPEFVDLRIPNASGDPHPPKPFSYEPQEGQSRQGLSSFSDIQLSGSLSSMTAPTASLQSSLLNMASPTPTPTQARNNIFRPHTPQRETERAVGETTTYSRLNLDSLRKQVGIGVEMPYYEHTEYIRQQQSIPLTQETQNIAQFIALDMVNPDASYTISANCMLYRPTCMFELYFIFTIANLFHIYHSIISSTLMVIYSLYSILHPLYYRLCLSPRVFTISSFSTISINSIITLTHPFDPFVCTSSFMSFPSPFHPSTPFPLSILLFIP